MNMNITRWNPFRELEEMSERLNNVFGRPVPARLSESAKELMTAPDWSPAVDIVETNNEYNIKAEIPGVKKEDVKVSVENGLLTIRGERKLEKEEKDKRYHRVERFYGTFTRSFSLPENVDETKVLAEFKDGMLNVHLPKSEKTKMRSVEIKVQ